MSTLEPSNKIILPRKKLTIDRQVIAAIFSLTVAINFVGFIVNSYDFFKNEIFDFGGLAVIFLFTVAVALYWSRTKLTYPSDDPFSNSSSVPTVWWLLFGAATGMMVVVVTLLTSRFFKTTPLPEIADSLIIFLSTFVLVAVATDLRRVTRKPKQPMGYLNKFLIKTLKHSTNTYQSTWTSLLPLWGLVIVLPLAFLLLILNDLALAVVIHAAALGILYGGYWTGYGIYRGYRWMWGTGTEGSSLYRDLGRQGFISVATSLLFVLYTLLLTVVILLVGASVVDTLPAHLTAVLILVFFFGQLKFLLTATSFRSESQPWFSFLFSATTLLTPVYYTLVLTVVLVPTSPTSLLRSLVQISDHTIPAFAVLFGMGVLLMFLTNSRHMRLWIWKDKEESNELLTEVNAHLEDPLPVHLNVLQRMGERQGSNETVMKLMATYQQLFEDRKINLRPDLLDSLTEFLDIQLLTATEWEIHALAFDLTHQFLEVRHHMASHFLPTAQKLTKHTNPLTQKASLELMGHIIHIDPSETATSSSYPLLEDLYNRSDEKQKKEVLEAFRFFANHVPTHANQVFEFLSGSVDQQTFGVATEVVRVLGEVAAVKPEHYEPMQVLCKMILSTQDHPGKLGVVQWLRENYPTEVEEQRMVTELLINNLRDEENLWGVRPNILYLIGELPQETSLRQNLPQLTSLMADEDPDVRSSFIQVIGEKIGEINISEQDLLRILTQGIHDKDYIVRLVTLKTLQNMAAHVASTGMNEDYSSVITAGFVDPSPIVQEEAVKTLRNVLAHTQALGLKQAIKEHLNPETLADIPPQIRDQLTSLLAN